MPEPTTVHSPSRPDWTCKAPDCEESWPCTVKRAELLATHQRALLVLRIYMAGFLHDAIEDAVQHPQNGKTDYWFRFMEWVPHTSAPPVRAGAECEAERAWWTTEWRKGSA